MDGDTTISVEAHENPIYICRQEKNNILIRCNEIYAQGILSLDASTVYQLDGKTSLNIDNNYIAYFIPKYEYEEIIDSRSSISNVAMSESDITEQDMGFDKEELILRVSRLEEQIRSSTKELLTIKKIIKDKYERMSIYEKI